MTKSESLGPQQRRRRIIGQQQGNGHRFKRDMDRAMVPARQPKANRRASRDRGNCRSPPSTHLAVIKLAELRNRRFRCCSGVPDRVLADARKGAPEVGHSREATYRLVWPIHSADSLSDPGGGRSSRLRPRPHAGAFLASFVLSLVAALTLSPLNDDDLTRRTLRGLGHPSLNQYTSSV